MATSSDRGHVRNTANLEELILNCTVAGSYYNPNRSELTIPSLTKILQSAQTGILNVNSAKIELTNAINERQIVFAPLKQIASRTVNALQSSGVAQQITDDARGYYKRMYGKRTPQKPVEGEEKRTISSSQLSYNYLVEHLSMIVTLVESISQYDPNEADIKVDALKAYIKRLRNANTSVMRAQTNYTSAIILRDRTLYAEGTGLVDIAKDVKIYVKSIFGASSVEYKPFSKLQFTSPSQKAKYAQLPDEEEAE